MRRAASYVPAVRHEVWIDRPISILDQDLWTQVPNMKRYVLNPVGWPCSLRDCRPGPFVAQRYQNQLCFKSEYSSFRKEVPGGAGTIPKIEAFNEAGEYLTLGDDDLVQPVELEIEEFDPL